MDKLKNLAKNARVQKKKPEGTFTTMVRDADGEKEVKSIGAKLKAAGKVYTDETFPAGPSMLFADPKHPALYMQPISEKFSQGLVKWLRPDEIGNTKEHFQVFAEGIEPEDINQVHPPSSPPPLFCFWPQ